MKTRSLRGRQNRQYVIGTYLTAKIMPQCVMSRAVCRSNGKPLFEHLMQTKNQRNIRERNTKNDTHQHHFSLLKKRQPITRYDQCHADG